jgi:protein O-mannosyl-transferase
MLITWLAYAPGLHGSFLFDDFANLPALGNAGPINNWPAFWRYTTSGTADPTGRPLTLLTFLLDAHNWPAAPLPFKRTNLILHLLNGALLAWLLQRLGRMLFPHADRKRINMAAWLGATFWLLHPLFVSTTLYVVQREAMLPSTFTLLGLLSWLHGRQALLIDGRKLRGLAWILAGLSGCTLFALLSKANGILLPAFALVIEYTVLRTSSASTINDAGRFSIYRRILFLLAWLPAMVLSGYLLDQGWNGFTHNISSVRTWTLGQRLLTEPRVLMDYLDLLWLPRPFTPGLFNDNVPASTSLWSPYTTLPALIVVLALIISACRYRDRWPALAASILFYFVGQSIESSTIPLELYFEHRNYLPAMLMFWPLALWLSDVRSSPSIKAEATSTAIPDTRNIEIPPAGFMQQPAPHKSKLILAAVLVLGISLMTHARAELWGNTHDQAILWATLNPDSPRAQAYAATAERAAGHPERAVVRLQRLLAKEPDQLQLALNLLDAECQLGHIDQATLTSAHLALGTTHDPGGLLVHWFEGAIEQTAQSPCPQLTLHTIGNLLDAARTNTLLATRPGRQQDIDYLQGRLELIQGHADMALVDFNHALDQQVREPLALKQAALLGSMGYPRQGLAHLGHYEAMYTKALPEGFGMPRVHAWVLQLQNYWPNEMTHLRTTLVKNAANQASRTK